MESKNDSSQKQDIRVNETMKKCSRCGEFETFPYYIITPCTHTLCETCLNSRIKELRQGRCIGCGKKVYCFQTAKQV